MRQIPLGNHLGDYLREQRQSARLSLRQLADLAGISNPYLSQIERGLKKPSAEILQQLAKGLQVSAESLYVRAGILDERPPVDPPAVDTRGAISADPQLTDRQKSALLDIYDSFVGAADAADEEAAKPGRRHSGRSGKAAKGARPAAAAVTTKTTKTAETTETTKAAGSTTRRAAKGSRTSTRTTPKTSTEKE